MQGEWRTKRKPCFQLFVPSRSLPWATAKGARRVENKAKTMFSAFCPEPKPALGDSQRCKASGEQSENHVFSFLSRAEACLGRSQIHGGFIEKPVRLAGKVAGLAKKPASTAKILARPAGIPATASRFHTKGEETPESFSAFCFKPAGAAAWLRNVSPYLSASTTQLIFPEI